MSKNMEERFSDDAMPTSSGIIRQRSKPEWSCNGRNNIHAMNTNRPEQHHQHDFKQCCRITILYHYQRFKQAHKQDGQGELNISATYYYGIGTDKPSSPPYERQQ